MSDFISEPSKYRVGDIVKYSFLANDFSTATILELNKDTVKIEIGLPYSTKNDIYKDVLYVPYSQILPFTIWKQLQEKQKSKIEVNSDLDEIE